jgi:hypothetical protein
MHIDKAIEMLEAAKKTGIKNIIFSYWDAEIFNTEDDEDWAHDAAYMEQEMDWSRTNDALENIRQSLNS